MKREYTAKELQENARKAVAEMERKAKLHGKNVELGPAKVD